MQSNVVPAKAGTQLLLRGAIRDYWVPAFAAFAGTTAEGERTTSGFAPAR